MIRNICYSNAREFLDHRAEMMEARDRLKSQNCAENQVLPRGECLVGCGQP